MDNYTLFTLKLLKYWRNCLADAEKSDLDPLNPKEVTPGQFIKALGSEVSGGQVSADLARGLINVYKAKIAKENKNYSAKNLEEQDIQDIKILVCPIYAMPRTEQGKKVAGRDKPIRPIWIPARLDRDGQLSPVDNDLPWIPRILLEPMATNSETVGTIEAVDKFLATHPFPDQGSKVNWGDIWRYSNELLQTATGQTIEDFFKDNDDYEVSLDSSYIVLDTPRDIAKDIIRFYDQLQQEIEKGRPVPPLLKRYTNPENTEPVQFLPDTKLIEKSADHLGQMNSGFSLYPSQREALHHALMMEEGEILAVNGPPGNGKTTLIQSVVATLWVEAALRGQEPPVIVATSTNNQAITNIIDSFGKTVEEEDQSCLSGRWIPGVTSYGLYCPAPSKWKDAAGFQRTRQKKDFSLDEIGGFYLAGGAGAGSSSNEDENIEKKPFVDSAREEFLKRCSECAKQNFDDLGPAVGYLHKSLDEVASEIRTGPRAWIKLERITNETNSTYGSRKGIDEQINRLNQDLEQCQSEALELKNVRKGWTEHLDRAPWWVHLMNFVPRQLDRIFRQARSSVAAYNKRYLSEIGRKVEGDLANPGTIEDFFDRLERGLEEKAQKLSADLRRAELDKSELEQAERDWEVWRAKNDLRGEPPELLALMDTKLRHKAFKLATHYWEGRWLIEMNRFNHKRKESQELPKQEERWRRYAKLTPCIVVTLHKLESFFNAYDLYNYAAKGEKAHIPLYEFIDLLIIDEAGQVSPDVAGANFALARKALVVGDTKQLKPIQNITPGIDRANMKKHEVVPSEQEAKAIEEAGFNVAESLDAHIPGGTVMKIAQRASRYQKEDAPERGMFLAEHHRCVPEIIAYCNKLAYEGRLKPQRESDQERKNRDPDYHYPFPRMGYMHIPGKSRRKGSSWINKAEAQAIAMWIEKNLSRMESHQDYRNKPIGEIIAVLTPYKAQEREIKEALGSQFEEMTVGTVHALQGAERPVILYSSVYSPGDGLSFMNDEVNMLNVAVSRAKDSFLVFGHMDIFKREDARHLPSGILADYLFADQKNNNQLIDDEIIRLLQERQNDMFASQHKSSIKLFISYAHTDDSLREQLVTHLSNLKRQQIIYDWHDRRIVPGQEWDHQINAELNEAQIILLLISARFIASDYCYSKEMLRAIERHDAEEAVVIPIILSACDWQGAPFSKLQALPKDAKPVKNWDDPDEAWLDVVRGLRRAIEMLSRRHPAV